jgi:hypothetical protein
MAFSKMYYEHLLVIHSARKKLECSRASPVVAQTPGYRPKAGCLWSCHALGSAWVKCSSCSALAAVRTMFGARSVRRSRRLTKLRVMFSASAMSAAERQSPSRQPL